MRLINIDGNKRAADVLFELLSERPQYAWISHGVMPSRADHEEFVENHPFRLWYLISAEEGYVGALEVTDRNEIGVHILKRYQCRGYGSEAVKLFTSTHVPLPPIKAVRNGRWLVNVATGNDDAKMFFKRLGFKPLQETLAL